MTCYTYHLYIDYDLQTGAYQGIKLRRNGDPTLVWRTDDPPADWKSCHAFADRFNLKILQSRSVQDFNSQVSGWRLNGEGILQAAQAAPLACDTSTEYEYV